MKTKIHSVVSIIISPSSPSSPSSSSSSIPSMAALYFPPWMAYFSQTSSMWVCKGGVGPPCVLRCAIDAVNLLFILVFVILLQTTTTTKFHHVLRNRGFFSTLSASTSSAVAFMYLVSSIFCFVTEKNGGVRWGWAFWFARFLIWMAIAFSSLMRPPKCLSFLIFSWLSTFFFLSSAFNVYSFILHSYDILDLIPWPVTFFLFFSSLKNLLNYNNDDNNDYGGSTEALLRGKIVSGEGETDFCSAGWFTKMTFSWLNPLLNLGYSRPLVLEDVPSLSSEDEAFAAYQRLADTLKEAKASENGLISAMVKIYLKESMFVVMYALVRTLSTLASPVLIYAFVNYSGKEDRGAGEGMLLVGCLVAARAVESISQRHMFFDSRRQGMRMRSSLMVAVYEKELRLTSSGKRRHSTGEIVNYIAVDAYRMGECLWWFHMAWSLTIQLFLSVVVLFFMVGVGAMAGVFAILLCTALNFPIARTLRRCQTGLMAAQDERLRSTSEVLNNMKIIKLQSWEGRFMRSVESLREKEFRWLSKVQLQRACCSILYWMSPTLISSVIFTGCLVFSNVPLNAGTMFTVLATLRGLSEPVRVIPDALSVMIQVKVSLDRLDTFLRDDEVQHIKEEEISGSQILSTDNTALRIKNGSFCWNVESSLPPTLRSLNLEVRRGEKIAICGPVGAGKSSLFYALLKEMPSVSGSVSVTGSVAFVSQVSWIQSGTVRENILYGKPMENSRYGAVIKACALDKDINCFSHGDLTEIGQRGLNLSGGQKQRLQLARALYNDADVYLLDDPFSAVDAHTAAILFHEYVLTALKSKTVLLVTHQVEYLSEVDTILVMEGGEIKHSGCYEELLSTGTSFKHLVRAHKSVIAGTEFSNSEIQTRVEKKDRLEESDICLARRTGEEKGGSQLTEEEWKEVGNIGCKPFMDYVMISKGSHLLWFSLAAQLGFILLQAAASYWIALALTLPQVTSGMLVGVYTVLSVLSIVFVYARTYIAVRFGLRASSAFFSAINTAIFKAPMLFFDTTPIGRIFTRMSSDLSVIDIDLPLTFFFVIAASIELVGIIGVMTSVTWQVVVVAAPVLVASNYVQKYCLASVTELVRINGTTKAPLMNYAAETSSGVVTIRAFKMEERFFGKYLKLVDRDAKLFFHSNAAMEWMVFRVEALQNLTLVVSSCLLLFLPKSSLPQGLVGLSLSYAMTLTGTQVFITRWFCNLLNYIISLERIEQYTRIPREPPEIVEGNRPPSSWPSRGNISLHDLKVRYGGKGPLVLKGITCRFGGGSKVGVVGRTGSGKTTLITALFRLVEAESGRIVIDGVDISKIGVRDLRMKLSIIPQEPTLFKGSIRTNLDPLGIYSDDSIWDALDKCQLKNSVKCLPNGLDSFVSEEGENWSVGQRQLFCMGRVLLRRNRILVMDEATASIDTATDALLHEIIKQEFEGCTVITVAHRVPTVIHSDMVLVLSYGNAVEYEEPSKLMERDSFFSNLVAQYWSSCNTPTIKTPHSLLL